MEASIFLGTAIDSFAGGETNKYINPDDASLIKSRMVGGVDLEFRVLGDPKRLGDQKPDRDATCSAARPGSARAFFCRSNLWFFLQTVHGVRSKDVDCTSEANKNLAVCKAEYDPTDPQGRFVYLLRNASTLEAFMGMRWEFGPILQLREADRARLYLKTQPGFIIVSGGGGDAVDLHKILAFGITATAGPLQRSYVEIGMGRNDLMTDNTNTRAMLDAFLAFPEFAENTLASRLLGKNIRPFLQITVDVDVGTGSDSIQSYLGIDYQIR